VAAGLGRRCPQALSTDPTYGWAITSPTGPIATIPRPITDAVLTFTNAQTATIQIVGARRPRRLSQFQECRGVAARDLNQIITDIVAMLREDWDKINDATGRGLFFAPGNTTGPMPLPSACAGAFLGFDSTGLNPQCIPAAPGSGTVTGPSTSTVNDIPTFSTTSGQTLGDSGVSLGSQATNLFLATPSSGAGVPVFRVISGADLPPPSASTLGGIKSYAAVAHQWINAISTGGAPSSTQPAITDLQAIATSSAVGNVTGSSAAPAALTSSQLASIVAPFTSSTQGATPASGGGTTNFLRADGNWSVPPSGALTLLNTLTASNSASLSDTTSLTSSFSSYEIVYENVIPATNATSFELQLQVSGTFQTSGYVALINIVTTTGTNSASVATSFIPLSNLTASFNGAPGVSGKFRIYNPSATAIIQVTGEAVNAVNSSTMNLIQYGGSFNTSAAVTGLKFIMSSGNITSGTIKIYGVL
jgi:hypothetical protein